MKKIFFSFFTTLLLIVVSSSTAFAGGGPVSLHAFPLRPFDQTKTFILQADTYASESCDQIKPTFTFAESIDGDSITPFTPPDDGTYLIRHYNTGYPSFVWKEICTTYAQAKSGQSIQRVIKVSVVVNGKTQERTTPVAFGNDSISQQLQNFGRMNDYDNTPWIDVINEKYIGNDKREVNLQWQKISWAAKYFLLAYVVKNDGTISSPSELTTTENTKTTVTLPTSADYKIIIRACKADDPCSSAGSYDGLLLSKMYNTNQQPQATPTTAVNKTTPAPSTILEQPTIAIPTSPEDKKIEELNKKVAELEGKLEKSQQKQNALEQTLNNLLSWIKSRFWFFK